MAGRLERWTCHSEAPSSSPALTLAGFAHCTHCSLELKSLATLVNSQLVYLRPIKVLSPDKFDLKYLFQAFVRPL